MRRRTGLASRPGVRQRVVRQRPLLAICSLLTVAALGLQVARIVEAAPSSFELLKAGNERADADGNRTWDSKVSLLARKPCAIWQYKEARRYAPSHRCKLVDFAPCAEAHARFSGALRELSRVLGAGWKLEEDRNETGIVRTSLRRKQGPVVMVDFVPLQGLGRCDVNLNVDAYQEGTARGGGPG